MNRNNIRPFLCGMLASLALCVCATTALADFSPANPLKFNTLNMRVAGSLVLREDENLTSDNGATIPSSILYTDEFGGGTTYLPVRIVTQSLSLDTEWMQNSHTLEVRLEGDQELRTYNTHRAGTSFEDPDTKERTIKEIEPRQAIGTNLIERFNHQGTETYAHTFDNLDPSKGSNLSITITNNGRYPLKFDIGMYAGEAFTSIPTQVPAGETVTRTFTVLSFDAAAERPLAMQLGNAPGTLHQINAEISAVQFK